MKILLFGTGNIAEVAYYYLKNDSKYNIVAFILEKSFIEEKTKFNLPIVAFEDIKEKYNPNIYSLFAPCNTNNLNKFRERIYNKGKEMGYNFISYISSKASVFTKDIGENCFILENNTIQPYTKIGNNCILWSGNHIGHHSIIEDHVFISSQVVISGMCLIKKYSYLGVNSTIKDYTIISENTVIGMHSCVTKNTESYNIYIGCPAKIYKKCDDTLKL
jgi:sugar O-acyltransferase (sialic acid O-acetyltransferase NeuD family)